MMEITKNPFKQYFRSKTMILIFVMYLVVMLIPITANRLFYSYSCRLLEKEIDESGYMRFEALCKDIEEEIELVNNTIKMYQINSQLLYLLRNDTGDDTFLFQRKELADHLYMAPDMDAMFIYNPKANYFLGSSSVTDMQIFENKLSNKEIIISDNEAFRNLLSKKYTGELIYLEQPAGKSVPVYLYTIPYSGTSVLGNFCYFFDIGGMEKSLRDIALPEYEKIFVLAQDGKTIASSTRELFDTGSIGKDDIVLEKELISGMKYVSVISYSYFYKNLQPLVSMSNLILVACIVLDLFLIILFTYVNYRPLLRILSACDINIKQKAAENEYEVILNAVSASKDKDEKIKLLTSHYNKSMKLKEKNILLKLLFGEKLPENVETLDFDFEHFRVGWICIDSEGIFDKFKEHDTLIFVIENLMSELIQNKNILIEHNGGIFLLVDVVQDADVLIDECEKLCDFLYDHFEILITIYLSDILSGIREVKTGSAQCHSMQEDTLLLPNQNILIYDEVPKILFKNINRSFDKNSRTKLFHAMTEKKEQEAFAVLDDIFACSESLTLIRYLTNNLANVFSDYCQQELMNVELLDEDIYPLVSQLIICDDRESAKKVSYDIVKALLQFSATMRIEKHEIVNECVRIIEENLGNPDLNVSKVAEMLSVSQTYLSKNFINHYNMGVLEFINKRRIQWAKKLLDESNLSVALIAEKVGYSSANTFIRVFKRHMGVTPKNYKENKKLSN